jgi:hypothetical protein
MSHLADELSEMSGPDDLIATFTAKQHGLVALWQTRSVGIPDHIVKARGQSGVLIRVYAGVYRLRGVRYTQDLRWLAGVLAAGPEAWLSHRAAAAFHGFEIRHPKPEVTVAHHRDCDLAGIEAHRTRRRHDVITVNGMPVTTKARSLLDSAAVLAYDAFETLLQNAITSGDVKIEAMFAILDHRGGRGVDGTVATRTALSGGLVDEKIQQRLELIVARIVRRAKCPDPVRQHRLVCRDGRVVFLDNAWPDRKVTLEAEGLRWHGNATQARKTRERARAITASGWERYAVGWYEATETPAEITRLVESFWEGSGSLWLPDSSQNEDPAA